MVVKLLAMYGEPQMTTKVHARAPFGGWTALDSAAHYGHLEIVKLLAPIPPPVTYPSHQHYLSCALIYAANANANNVIEISRYLISEGADVNFFDEATRRGPLLCAVWTSNLALVQCLLAMGANPNLHNPDRIPLFYAIRRRNTAIVQALLSGGADIHVEAYELNNTLLLSKSTELLRLFLERGVDPHAEDIEGDTALHHACTLRTEFGKASVKLLLQFGAAPDKPNNYDETPIEVAMNEGLTEVVEIMEPLIQDLTLRAKIAKWREEESQATFRS
ncbi:ankyrin repeat-containing domain protein [Mycena galopus ATCC 62051]|nr:ankyrin repeat-containing domain protein [Mycena galopus ATCC 62051]